MQTRHALPQAARITVVGDREGDWYAVLAQLQAHGLDFVFRRQQERGLVDEADTLCVWLARQLAQGTTGLTQTAGM